MLYDEESEDESVGSSFESSRSGEDIYEEMGELEGLEEAAESLESLVSVTAAKFVLDQSVPQCSLFKQCHIYNCFKLVGTVIQNSIHIYIKYVGASSWF